MSTHQNEKSARISSLAKSFKSHLMPNVRWLHRRVAANLFEFICIYGLFMHTIQLDFVLFALLSPLANKNQQHRTSHQFRAMSTVIGHCRECERERAKCGRTIVRLIHHLCCQFLCVELIKWLTMWRYMQFKRASARAHNWYLDGEHWHRTFTIYPNPFQFVPKKKQFNLHR